MDVRLGSMVAICNHPRLIHQTSSQIDKWQRPLLWPRLKRGFFCHRRPTRLRSYSALATATAAADSSLRMLSAVRYWHLAGTSTTTVDVRLRG